MPATVSTPVLRNLIDRYLLGDSELEAFVLDHFPQVKRLYGNGMDRTAKVNLLFERADCSQIYENLRLRYPHGVPVNAPCPADICHQRSIPQTDTCPASAEGKSDIRYFLVLTGTVDVLDEPKIRALVKHIRKISGDAELTLEAIKSGSIILHFKGTPEGFERLHAAFYAGALREVLGFSLKDVGRGNEQIKHSEEIRASGILLDSRVAKKESLTHTKKVPRGRSPRWLAAAILTGALCGVLLAPRHGSTPDLTLTGGADQCPFPQKPHMTSKAMPAKSMLESEPKVRNSDLRNNSKVKQLKSAPVLGKRHAEALNSKQVFIAP